MEPQTVPVQPPPGPADRTAILLTTVEKELRSLSPYIAVMREQLSGAVQETDAGVMAVIERIMAVHGLSSAQIERIQESMALCTRMVGVTHTQSGCNQQVITLVRGEMQMQLEALNGNIERILGLAGEVRDLRKIVETITDIASQTHLLAINAAIQATHAGASGAAFKVVASEVKVLSLRTAVAAKEIAQKIDALAQRMAKEVEAAHAALSLNNSGTRLQGIIKDIGTIEARLDASSEDLMTIMGNIQTNNDDVVTQLTAALGYIQFQDVVRQRVEQVGKALHELGEHSRTMVEKLSDEAWDGTLSPTMEARLASHVATYVMASQRDTHGSVLGAQAMGGGHAPAIELF